MYTVVICPDCQYVWIVENVPDRTKCGQCRTSHQFKKLKHLHRTDDVEEARRARAAATAHVMGEDEAFERALENGAIDREHGSVIDDDLVFEQAGIDPADVATAGEISTGGSRSETEIVEDAIREQTMPSRDEAINYAVEHGVEEQKAQKIITRLLESGEVIRQDDGLMFV